MGTASPLNAHPSRRHLESGPISSTTARHCFAASFASISLSAIRGEDWLHGHSHGMALAFGRLALVLMLTWGGAFGGDTGAALSSVMPSCYRTDMKSGSHLPTSSPEMRYPESATSELIFIVFCRTSKMTAVDHPNIRAPFIAVIGPSSFQSSTGVTSP
jgi:hypothetical protein